MQIMLIQNSPVLGAKSRNLAALTETIGKSQSDLLLLPELFATGYYFESRDQVSELAEEISGGTTIDWMVDLASASGGLVCGGLVERAGDDIYNSAVIVNADGPVLTYRKIHLFFEESRWFTPGNRPPEVYQHGAIYLGLMICFDWRFPEVARSLSLQGAQILLHPANLVQSYCQDAMVTRSLENGVYTATANRIGSDTKTTGESLIFTGRSQVTSPQGEILARASQVDTEVISIELEPELARDKAVTQYNHLLNDRQPWAYQEITDNRN
ncbi:nitrilase-related carbon-nitrogen hydrolase [Candidatus Neomarinimicrobiota bacterium]